MTRLLIRFIAVLLIYQTEVFAHDEGVTSGMQCYRCDYDSDECKDPFNSTHSKLRIIEPHNSNPCAFCFKKTIRPKDFDADDAASVAKVKIEKGCMASGASTVSCTVNGTQVISSEEYEEEWCYCNTPLCNTAAFKSPFIIMIGVMSFVLINFTF